MITGGDLKEITFKNTGIGLQGRYFSKSGESHMVDIGGLTTADDATNIDTGGSFMNIKTTKPWSYVAVIAWDKNLASRKELQTYQAMSNTFEPTTWTFQCIDGTIWAGQGSVVGDVVGDASKGTIAFKVMGSGNLVQI